ncbi:ATP synthase-coupling factor 6, mitochondrial-like [Ornithodoros turicata]|uniref:ATP synthase-coupling factor 6, mitochondrial n=1 Tax=Ornithodoros turicata TaxID=34597 RepID=A0A2R5LES0_9ACAR
MALNGSSMSLARRCLVQCKRNYGITAVLAQKTPTDPIQKLFVDKLREYTQKSKSSGDLFVDPNPAIKKEYDDEIKRAETQYGGGKGVDMSKFPEFKFVDPELDPISTEKK